MHHTTAIMDEGKLVFGSCNEQHAKYEYFHFLISKNHLHKEQSILVVLEYWMLYFSSAGSCMYGLLNAKQKDVLQHKTFSLP